MKNYIKLPVTTNTYRYYAPMMNILYPVVENLDNYVIQQQINCKIYDLMLRIASDLIHLDLPTYITGSYEIKANERNFLALNLIQLGDFGGAHPMTIIKSLNINIETGEVYCLDDLFKPGSNYVERLSKIIAKDIKERDIPVINEFEFISPNQDFYIVDNNLIIYFQLYELAPYFYGFPLFSIPIQDIEDIINDNGPLSTMMGMY